VNTANATGVIVVNKPEGWTSHDVVAKMRGIAGTRRVGHLGTLDPIATGVLPLMIGHATRLAQFWDKAEKSYEAVIRFEDKNLGPQSFTAGKDFGDFLIWRKDGLPSYQLACVVDDASTNITEVVRGRDLLKAPARQILLQRALLLPAPGYFHTHLLTDEHGIRLAKRHDILAIRTLRQQGLAPAQVLQMAAAHMTTVTSNR